MSLKTEDVSLPRGDVRIAGKPTSKDRRTRSVNEPSFSNHSPIDRNMGAFLKFNEPFNI
jgi:hypothetical protein